MFTVLNYHCNIKLAPPIAPPNLSDHGDTTLFIFLMYIILLGFSQTFLELTSNVDIDVCPGVVAVIIAQPIIHLSNAVLNLIFLSFQYHNLVLVELKVVVPSLFYHYLVILSAAYS